MKTMQANGSVLNSVAGFVSSWGGTIFGLFAAGVLLSILLR